MPVRAEPVFWNTGDCFCTMGKKGLLYAPARFHIPLDWGSLPMCSASSKRSFFQNRAIRRSFCFCPSLRALPFDYDRPITQPSSNPSPIKPTIHPFISMMTPLRQLSITLLIFMRWTSSTAWLSSLHVPRTTTTTRRTSTSSAATKIAPQRRAMTTMIVSLARRSDDCSDDEESCENEDEPCEIGGGLQLQGSGNEEFGKDALDALERLYRASPDFPDHSETLLMQAEQLEKLWNLPDAEGYHVRENIVATSDHDFRMTSSSSDVLQGLERSFQEFKTKSSEFAKDMTTANQSSKILPRWRMNPRESLSDWTIELVTPSGNREYHVHQDVLCTGHKRSNYFALIFETMSSCISMEQHVTSSRIEMEDKIADAFPTVLDYMYAAEADEENDLEVTLENIPALIVLSNILDVKAVRDQVIQFCHTHINLESAGMIYECAKHLKIPKLQEKVIDLCHKKLMKIRPDSRLVSDSSTYFWVEVRRRLKEDEELVHFSRLLSAFCASHKTQLISTDFQLLTDPSVLPHIHHLAAEQLIQLEQEIVFDQDYTQISDLQARCIDFLANAWKDHEWSVDRLGNFTPLVLSNLIKRIVEISRSELNVGFPQSIHINGGGLSPIEGTYRFHGVLGYPLYVRDGFPIDNTNSQFCLYCCPHVDGHDYWYISIVHRGDKPGSDNDIDFYRAKKNGSGKLPPTLGWRSCREGIDPPPSLSYGFGGGTSGANSHA